MLGAECGRAIFLYHITTGLSSMIDRSIGRVVEYLKIFVEENCVTELRAFGDGNVYSGIFDYDHLEVMARSAIELQSICKGVYFVPNPTNLLANNQVVKAGKCTSDADIAVRKWLLIDIDPVRPVDQSSTEDEQKAAWKVLCNIESSMAAAGFAEPVKACSGNGWHISYPIDMPNTEESKLSIKALLNGLDARCSSPAAKVDVKTFNASRIWKLYGTTARKGIATEERPHRLAWVSSSPASISSDLRLANSLATGKLLEAWKQQDRAIASIESQRVQPELITRASQYLSKMPPAIAGQSGHNRTYHAAMILIDGFGLSVEDALSPMMTWNMSCVPPWSEQEILHKLRDAAKHAGDSKGHLVQGKPIAKNSAMQSRQSYSGPDSVPEIPIATDDVDATAADLISQQSTVQWTWPGWIQRGTITAIASDPGVGKTRLCADLLRRIYLGLPWPDGTPATFPAGSRAIWIASDSQWAELSSLPIEMGFSPEALVLNGYRSNPYAGTNLDTIDDLAALERRIRRVQPAIVFVDTCGSATDRNTTRPEEAKQFFKPLAEIATRTGTSIVLVTHLNKGGEALGRRIVGACRQVIKLDQPDAGQTNRRRLWVDKTNSKKPEPLGVTMADAGNEYDLSPPAQAGGDEPGQRSAKKSPHTAADAQWLSEYLALGAKKVGDTIKDAEHQGINIDRLYKARKSLNNIEQYEVDNRKWWRVSSNSSTGV